MEAKKYILTLSCKDDIGIVAAVSSSLADMGAFICQSSQFGDFSTGRFFMRCEFETKKIPLDIKQIKQKLAPAAEKYQMDWELVESAYKPRVLILVSKLSHCLNDLLHKWDANSLKIEIPAVISNHNTLKDMVEWHGIPFYHFPIQKEQKQLQEEKILELIEEQQIDLIVLARYMQILSPYLCKKLFGKAINIHHSFLPSFKGAKPYHQAYDRGVKIIGATAHYVTEDLDEGPIIEQETTYVSHAHTPQDLVSIGWDIESTVLSRAIKWQVERRILINGNKTVVFKP
ncbi:MAG: formyltetrahydrofolate deformylase [Simkaniaceae bacterium]